LTPSKFTVDQTPRVWINPSENDERFVP